MICKDFSWSPYADMLKPNEHSLLVDMTKS